MQECAGQVVYIFATKLHVKNILSAVKESLCFRQGVVFCFSDSAICIRRVVDSEEQSTRVSAEGVEPSGLLSHGLALCHSGKLPKGTHRRSCNL